MPLPLPHPVIGDQQVQQNFEAISSGVEARRIADLLRPEYVGSTLLSSTQRFVFNYGTSSPFVAATFETNTTTVSHGLGVVPVFISVTGLYSDNGRWLAVTVPGSYGTSSFQWFARDMTGAAHGPGTLDPFFWLAIGIK